MTRADRSSIDYIPTVRPALFLLAVLGCPEAIDVGVSDASTDEDAAIDGTDAAEPTDAGAIGGPCPCVEGVCATSAADDAGAPFCTTQCSPRPECPEGFICRTVLIDDQPGSACAPGSKKGLGALCTGSEECETNLCLVLEGGDPIGYCADHCAEGMRCPAAYVCVHFSDLGLDLCGLDHDGRDLSPGDTCFADVQCKSSTCIFDESRGFGACD
jgi:hypothetical protein